jgi:hypothetical protein
MVMAYRYIDLANSLTKQGTTEKLADNMSNMEDKERGGQTGKGLLSSEATCPQPLF